MLYDSAVDNVLVCLVAAGTRGLGDDRLQDLANDGLAPLLCLGVDVGCGIC